MGTGSGSRSSPSIGQDSPTRVAIEGVIRELEWEDPIHWEPVIRRLREVLEQTGSWPSAD